MVEGHAPIEERREQRHADAAAEPAREAEEARGLANLVRRDRAERGHVERQEHEHRAERSDHDGIAGSPPPVSGESRVSIMMDEKRMLECGDLRASGSDGGAKATSCCDS